MKPDLTIIIPCYNCSKTLEQAVKSCYTQGLEEAGFIFEIVMVDDGSTDTTKNVMERLKKESEANKNGFIRIFFHEKNRGGGATRNKAVEHAKADIIFCLDSDDMLGPGTLSKMLKYLLEKRNHGEICDGVGIHKSRKFKGDDVNDIFVLHTFGYVDQIIPLEALFQKDSYCSLYSTFMHTKEAFNILGGYPTQHGFDTQSFAWRFLMNGLVAYTCPNTEYLHRTHNNKSYYVREYESGKVNYNWFLILSEFIYIFEDSVKDYIFEFDINDEKNIFNELSTQENILASDYKKYVKRDTKKIRVSEIENIPDNLISKYDYYWLGNEYAIKKDYDKAFHYFLLAYDRGLRHPDQFSTTLSLYKSKNIKKIINTDLVKSILVPKKFVVRGSSSPIIIRIFRKIIKIIKKNDFLYNLLTRIYWFYLGIKNFFKESTRKKNYYASIEQIKKDKRIIVDLKFGGLGDCLVWSTLPRLLKEKYDINFYLSEQSLAIIRNKDIYRLCFEINPYYKGTQKNGPYFSFDTFESEKSIYTLLTNKGGKTIIELLEKQFSLLGNGIPEIYYRPNVIESYKKTILIDNNFITGKKLGWKYKENSFENEAKRHMSIDDEIKYIDTKKQDLFGYIDLIYSCKYFVCTFSGGASIAACFDKPFSVIWPTNGKNGSNYQFRYKMSRGKYI